MATLQQNQYPLREMDALMFSETAMKVTSTKKGVRSSSTQKAASITQPVLMQVSKLGGTYNNSKQLKKPSNIDLQSALAMTQQNAAASEQAATSGLSASLPSARRATVAAQQPQH